jgi:hypothetical protein
MDYWANEQDRLTRKNLLPGGAAINSVVVLFYGEGKATV